MITVKGESFLMKNLFKETKEYIKYIGIGDDDTTPNYSNITLNNEILRTPANINYNTNQKALITSAEFEIKDIEKAQEIGLITNQNTLISHDVFQGIPSGYESTIHLEYNLLLETFYKIPSWKRTQYNNVYLALINEVVDAIYETSTNNGYQQKNNITDVTETPASFFYETTTRQLYVHPSIENVNPVDLNIMIKTR